MFAFLTKLLLIARSRLKSRASLEAENLVLRQQVIVLSRQSRSRVRLRNMDRLIFVWLYRFFPAILNAITVVKPETLIRWHRRGFGPIGAGNPADVVAAPRSTATSIPVANALSAGSPSVAAMRTYLSSCSRVRASSSWTSSTPLKLPESMMAMEQKTTPLKCPGNMRISVIRAWRPSPP